MKKIMYGALGVCLLFPPAMQGQEWNTPGAGNPILPGYFADPTVKKFGDTYYLYSTTDGTGGGFGPSQVWTSKDFQNWTILPMNWPTTHHIWAPDVMKGDDGRYYMYHSVPCQLYCGVSDTPRGPWQNLLGKEDSVLVPDRFVKNVITLDGQTFRDDDGATYLYWGTWGIYKDFGAGIGKFAKDYKRFEQTKLLPNTEALHFFEAPFMLKKDGVYYFMYSCDHCEDASYHVEYAYSTDGPMGPFHWGKNNPILATTPDETVHGPGHNSVIKEGDKYYVAYHRHNIPRATQGFHRQVCVDELTFGQPSEMCPVQPTHKGVGALQPTTVPVPNVAFCKSVKASSEYSEAFKASYAVDDNNATLWRPAGMGREWLEIDLGKIQPIARIWTQFEYATYFYQYRWEYSTDAVNWTMYADKNDNEQSGSPMVDRPATQEIPEARYVRLTVEGCQKNGYPGAVWNVKVFNTVPAQQEPPQLQLAASAAQFDGTLWHNTTGMLAGSFFTFGEVKFVNQADQDGLSLQADTKLISSFLLPASFFAPQRYTCSYRTFATPEKVLSLSLDWGSKSIVAVTKAAAKKLTATGLPTWHQVVYVSDGKIVTLYLDGTSLASVKEKKVEKTTQLTCTANEATVITDLRFYNWQQEKAEWQFDATQPIAVLPPASREKKGLFIDITADDYQVGTQLSAIQNRVGGEFTAVRQSLPVADFQGKRAFAFDGSQWMRSSFAMPNSICDNAPYSLAAWVYNPNPAPEECVADLITSEGELQKIMLCSGTEPRAGIARHFGYYQDMGFPKDIDSTKWQHWAFSYDGYNEHIYLNGKLLRTKNIILLLPKSESASLGATAIGDWPFSGYLHSLKVWDMPLTGEEIEHIYESK